MFQVKLQGCYSSTRIEESVEAQDSTIDNQHVSFYNEDQLAWQSDTKNDPFVNVCCDVQIYITRTTT